MFLFITMFVARNFRTTGYILSHLYLRIAEKNVVFFAQTLAYVQQCATKVRPYSSRMLMQGLGEVLLDNQSKNFAREQLITETATALELFALCPLIAE